MAAATCAYPGAVATPARQHAPHPIQAGLPSAMKRILIVDDQPDLRELVRMTLEIDGHEVHEAEDGPSALQAVRRLAPELVMLDVMMPGGMDGLAVCRALRADPTRRRTRVVMLSARGQKVDIEAGRAAGADAYLAKPFSPRQLLDVVSRLV